tara:strand:- start:138 stop:773 length:636 start_codon:yes stop_codon:yes gene_type:complete
MPSNSRIEILRALADADLNVEHLDDVTDDVQDQLDALTSSVALLSDSGGQSGTNVLFHKADVTTTSSQSLTAMTPAEIVGLTITLTPQSVNSEFLLMGAWNGESSSGWYHNTVFGFKRDNTYIGNPTDAGTSLHGRGIISMGHHGNDSNGTPDSWTGQLIDTPNTTSPVTYKVFITTEKTCTLYNNRTVSNLSNSSWNERTTSSLIILERS